MKFLLLSLLPLVAIALATPDLAHLQRMIARFAPTDLRVTPPAYLWATSRLW